MDDRIEKINELINKLADIGQEYKDVKVGKWNALGSVFSSLTDSRRDIAFLAYEFFEAHNYHAICALFNWVFGLYDFKHVTDLDNIKWLVENTGTHNVKMVKNEDGTWQTKKFRVNVTFEEVE